MDSLMNQVIRWYSIHYLFYSILITLFKSSSNWRTTIRFSYKNNNPMLVYTKTLNKRYCIGTADEIAHFAWVEPHLIYIIWLGSAERCYCIMPPATLGVFLNSIRELSEVSGRAATATILIVVSLYIYVRCDPSSS